MKPAPITATPEQVQRLAQWAVMQAELSELKIKEKELRDTLFGELVPAPVEGTNTVILPNGYALKATHAITRNILKDEFLIYGPIMLEAGIAFEDFIEFKPTLKLAEYRKLPQAMLDIVDRFVETKPGSPQLKVVEVKR